MGDGVSITIDITYIPQVFLREDLFLQMVDSIVDAGSDYLRVESHRCRASSLSTRSMSSGRPVFHKHGISQREFLVNLLRPALPDAALTFPDAEVAVRTEADRSLAEGYVLGLCRVLLAGIVERILSLTT